MTLISQRSTGMTLGCQMASVEGRSRSNGEAMICLIIIRHVSMCVCSMYMI